MIIGTAFGSGTVAGTGATKFEMVKTPGSCVLSKVLTRNPNFSPVLTGNDTAAGQVPKPHRPFSCVSRVKLPSNT